MWILKDYLELVKGRYRSYSELLDNLAKHIDHRELALASLSIRKILNIFEEDFLKEHIRVIENDHCNEYLVGHRINRPLAEIVLAGFSPSQEKAFASLGLDYICESCSVDETITNWLIIPETIVSQVARLKAETVATGLKSHYDFLITETVPFQPDSCLVIGAHSIGYCNGKIMTPLTNKEEAFVRLKELSGTLFQIHTGICMLNMSSGLREEIGSEINSLRTVKTFVQMHPLQDEEIRRYLTQDNSFNNLTWGYDPLRSLTFVKAIEGNLNNFLFGLPCDVITQMLVQCKYHKK